MKNSSTLILGANSDIAKALAHRIVTFTQNQLIVVSRNINFYQQAVFKEINVIELKNYHAEEISIAVDKIKKITEVEITQVFICHGVLHNQHFQPEKRLEDFSEHAFMEVLKANTLTPMLWLKELTPLLTGENDCKITFFSARVGSISDNKLGGWYSYRASKAAMNMLIKSAAVELARRAKNIKLIAFHPGTTDTPLSKPFQKNVPSNKLFTSEFVATRLLDIIENTPSDQTASYLDWQGKSIDW
jgi:NAD(P)-dependent dehydrogenase (short-subunit alcohol dehydrogenase family)